MSRTNNVGTSLRTLKFLCLSPGMFSSLLLKAVVLCALAPTLVYGSDVVFPERPGTGVYYVDKDALISPEHREAINTIADDLMRDESVALRVVVINSLAEYNAAKYSIENYATRLFNAWGIGSSQRNYGMLLLISKNDRKARIELGADWAHDYDEDADYVMQQLIIPSFKRGEFSIGILDGVNGMDALARNLELPVARTPWWFIPAICLGIVIAIGTIVSLFKSGRRGWGWALIAFIGLILLFVWNNRGHASGGYGGGSSGGGGATGSW